MQRNNALKTAWLAGVLVLLFVAGWELFWRSKGYTPTYNDDKALWANKRSEVYADQKEATVFIGSSRIKFDLDIPVWKKLTGEKAVQLSLVGTSPVLLLKDLADDPRFRGKVVVDVTEPLFFSPAPPFHKSAKEAIDMYQKQTPSERVSNAVGTALESKLAFLEEKRFALNKLLEDLELPNRPGVFSFPVFPKSFEWTNRDRQTYMPDLFLNNPAHVKWQTDIWKVLVLGNPMPPIKGEPLMAVLRDVKTNIDKIRARGGKVIFVRTPSSGPFYAAESKGFPRAEYWDAMLRFTATEGIHFADNPETAGMICPEWSHLAPKDAVSYTRILARQLAEKGWFRPGAQMAKL